MSGLKISDITSFIKNEPYIKEVIAKYNISDTEILDNLNVFEEAYKSINLCRNCNGINNCKQKTKGEVFTIGYDGKPINVIRYCKFLKTQLHIDKIRSSYVYTDIPNKLLTLNLDNIQPNNEWQELLFKPLYDILNKERNKGVYIYGGFGVGKTYFVSALANSLVEKGNKVVFVKCNPFVTDMYALLMEDTYSFENLLNKIKKADYLIIDDIGTENVSAFSRDRLLYNILEYRLDNDLCTIFTSNFDIKNLEVRFNQIPDPNAGRICERIKSLADEFILRGENQRHND